MLRFYELPSFPACLHAMIVLPGPRSCLAYVLHFLLSSQQFDVWQKQSEHPFGNLWVAFLAILPRSMKALQVPELRVGSECPLAEISELGEEDGSDPLESPSLANRDED